MTFNELYKKLEDSTFNDTTTAVSYTHLDVYKRQLDNSTHTSTYSASFTAGSLLHRETTSILHLLEAENTQELLKSEAKNNQYIQINSEKSRKRVIAEINKRYAVVKPCLLYTSFYSIK